MKKRLAALLFILAALPAYAHIASNGFLTLRVEGAEIDGQLELAVRDAEIAIGVDANHDGQVTWGELHAAEPRLTAYVATHLHLSEDGEDCPYTLGAIQVNERVDGKYAWLPIKAICPAAPERLVIDYSLLREVDPSHRGLLNLTAGAVAQTGVLGTEAEAIATPPGRHFSLTHPSRFQAFVEYLRAGVWHIWSGIDHLLFLLSLLLPAVLFRRDKQWQPAPQAGRAFWSVLKVVTAFTLAHSITLSLAAFDILRLPSRLTESAIAASIIVAALNNIWPRVTESRWRLAFGFGLLHGFGFASVLADMGLPDGARLLSLVAFNLGVEVGQLAVVIAVMPLAFLFRATTFYRRIVLPWGSAAIALLALRWFIERAFPGL